MVYQDLLSEESPYIAEAYQTCDFEMHYHYEIELIYCTNGGFKLSTNTKEYEVKAGQLIIINSLLPHEAIPLPNVKTETFLIRIGPSFLQNTFFEFASLDFKNPIFDLTCDKDGCQKKLRSYFDDLINYSKTKSKYSTLMTTGILYQLCATLLNDIPHVSKNSNSYYRHINSGNKIEEIIRYIYLHYNEKISIEKAAEICGYSKTNFCNIFKKQTGSTFHHYLNGFRVKKAKFLLTSSTLPISEIATVTGFEETKTFCRQFKTATGRTPTQYRAETSTI